MAYGPGLPRCSGAHQASPEWYGSCIRAGRSSAQPVEGPVLMTRVAHRGRTRDAHQPADPARPRRGVRHPVAEVHSPGSACGAAGGNARGRRMEDEKAAGKSRGRSLRTCWAWIRSALPFTAPPGTQQRWHASQNLAAHGSRRAGPCSSIPVLIARYLRRPSTDQLYEPGATARAWGQGCVPCSAGRVAI